MPKNILTYGLIVIGVILLGSILYLAGVFLHSPLLVMLAAWVLIVFMILLGIPALPMGFVFTLALFDEHRRGLGVVGVGLIAFGVFILTLVPRVFTVSLQMP
jgi:hypothetical protein